MLRKTLEEGRLPGGILVIWPQLLLENSNLGEPTTDLLHPRTLRMVFGDKPLLVEEQLRREGKTILKHAHLESCQIDFDPSLEFRKRLANKFLVDEKRHLSAAKVELDQIRLMWIAIKNRTTLDEHAQGGW